MTTARKLWLGFGVLTSIIVVFGVTLLVQLQGIQRGFQDELELARLRSAHAREIEINLHEYGVAVREFAVSSDRRAAGRAERGAAEFNWHTEQYQLLASTERQRQLASRLSTQWAALKAAGRDHLSGAADGASLPEFSSAHTALESLLDEELQVDALAAYEASRGRTVDDVQSSIFATLWLLAVGIAVTGITSIVVGRSIVASDAARARLAAIVESSNDAIYSCDRHGRILTWNKGAEKLFGWTAPEIVGMSLARLVPDDLSEQPFGYIIPAILRGEPVINLETRRLRKEGTQVDVLVTASPILGDAGEVVAISVIGRDISARKAADQRVRESESTLRSIYESSPLMMGVAEVPPGDHDIIHVYDSPATEQFFGVAPGSTFGKSAGALGLPRASIARWIAAYRRSERERRPVRFEYEHAHPSGPVWLSCVVMHIGPTESGRTRFSYVAEDITEQKRTAQLQAESVRQKDEFIAVLAHELRNPLAPIRMAVGILREQGAGQPILVRCRDVIDRQVALMARLLDDLLDVSRLSRGRMPLRLGQVALRDVLTAAIETSRPLIEQNQQTLEIDIPEMPIVLKADAARLTQVFGNLLNNAAKYSAAGSAIALSVRGGGNRVAVSIADQGVGIPESQIDRVFELFSQAESSREHRQGGLGIGLWLSRRLVELHGGDVQVSSAGAGRGSEFTVRLPVVEGAQSPGHEDRAGDPRRAPVLRRRVLVADDNKDSADMAAVLLSGIGCEVRTVYDGNSAVSEAEAFHPDVALLDIGMPGMSGHDACRVIRSQPWGAGMLIVALTGWGQEEDRRRSALAGFDAHLVKPVDPEALVRLLRERRASPRAVPGAP